jgi:hypothetical protein
MFLLPVFRRESPLDAARLSAARRKRANAEPHQREWIAWHGESHPTMKRASGTSNGTDTSTATRSETKHWRAKLWMPTEALQSFPPQARER